MYITYDCIMCGIESTRFKVEGKKQVYCSNPCKFAGENKYRYLAERPEVNYFSGETKLINELYIVDAEYYDWLNNFTWRTSDSGYAYTNLKINDKPTMVRMHRLLMQAELGQLVDHKNRNKFDNRMSNLRFFTKSQNSYNSDRSDNAKLYTYDKSRGKWRTQLGKRFKLPSRQFATAIEAEAYVNSLIPRGDR